MVLMAAAGLTALLVLHREAGRLNQEIVNVGRPAREMLGEIETAFSRRVYTLQEYLLVRDPRYLDMHRLEDERLGALNGRLAPLLTALDIGAGTQQRLERLLASWSASPQGALAGGGEQVTLREGAAARDSLHAETLAAMSSLRNEINAGIAQRLERIRTTEETQILIAIALALLAVAAALERTRLARLERAAKDEAERRARSEAALRQAASAVAAARTVAETVQRIADSALSSMRADGAAVERIDPDHAEVEVVAGSGVCAPRPPVRFAYARSLSSQAVEKGGAVTWKVARGDHLAWIDPYLSGRCESAKVLAVPLLDGDRAIGCLILLRSASGPDFDDEEAERLRTFGDLAALEFKRITLLSESERRRTELERVTESRARLIRGFSHDVKNALGAADGYAQLLEEGVVGRPSREQSAGIGQLRHAIGAAMQLTDDLLDLARIEAGQIAIDWTSTDVAALAQSAASAYAAQAGSKGILVSLRIERDLPHVLSDPVRVQQVLGNLLSNAVKYTPPEGSVQVVVGRGPGAGALRARDGVFVSVADNGPGIPEEQQGAVFDEFVRLTPEAGSGSGLGLAIARRVARALSGELTLRSEPGSGSEFTLWLPLEPFRPGADQRAKRSGGWSASRSRRSSSRAG
jgi:signal transduction histidine kinase